MERSHSKKYFFLARGQRDVVTKGANILLSKAVLPFFYERAF